MSIGRDDVLDIARLARLDVPEEELATLESQLVAILEAVSKVSELDLSGVEPMSHPLDLVNVWDEDEPRPSLPRDEAVAGAPDAADGLFRVPKVIG